MITPDSPLVAPPSGSLEQALAHAGAANTEYVREAWRLAESVGIDPAIVIAQWDLETDSGVSWRWREHHNPAGLLIESDDDPDPATWTQTEAARVHVWALAYLLPIDGELFHAAGLNNPTKPPWFHDRWDRKIFDINFPEEVETIADLQQRYVDATGESQAVWAWDDRYAEKLCQRHRAIFGETVSNPRPSGGSMPDKPVPGKPDSDQPCWWPNGGRG